MAAPYLSARQITVGRAPVLALRVTYVGELGWELHTPAEYGLHLWDTLWVAGRTFDIAACGYQAIDTLRIEKGYRYWSTELTPEHTPYEAGLGFCVKLDKGEFIGRAALAEQKQRGLARKLCCLLLDEGAPVVWGREPISDRRGRRRRDRRTWPGDQRQLRPHDRPQRGLRLSADRAGCGGHAGGHRDRRHALGRDGGGRAAVGRAKNERVRG